MIKYIGKITKQKYKKGLVHIMKVIEKYLEEIQKDKEQGRNIIACLCNNEVKIFKLRNTRRR